jgi:nickel transport system substrate-binding protein
MSMLRKVGITVLLLTGMISPSVSVAEQAKNSIVFANFRDIRDLNPHLYSGEMWAQNMLYESLVSITEKGIEPWLATRWEMSDDGKIYTFHLRDDVRFSDGEKFDAKVAKMNIDAILSNKARHTWLEMVRLIEKVEAVDDYTLRISLSAPYYPFLTEMAVTRPMRFISPKAMKSGETKNGVTSYIGTGPYMLSEHQTDKFAVFTVNPHYWGAKPSIERVTMKVIPDNQTRLMAFKKGEIELIYGKNMIDADAFNELEKTGKYQTKMSKPVSTRMILLNTTSENLNDVRVRKAIQHAVNKEDISEGIFNGSEVPANTLMAENIPYSNLGLKPYQYDPSVSASLLDAAGWKKVSG